MAEDFFISWWNCVCTVRQRTRGIRAPGGTQTTDRNSANFLEEFIKLLSTMEP